jgi:hypothetical protein
MIGTIGLRSRVQGASKHVNSRVSSPHHFAAIGKFGFVEDVRRIYAPEIGAYEDQSGSASADLELAVSGLLP